MKPDSPFRTHTHHKPKGAAAAHDKETAKTIPAAKVLKEFGIEALPAAPPDTESWLGKPKAHAPGNTPSVLEEAHARGVEEGRAAALAEAEARLAEQTRFHEKQLELERCTWVAREADKLATQMSDELLAVKTVVAERTARILKPFLVDEVHRHAMEALSEAIDAALSTDNGLKVEVSGPEDLLQLLRAKLSARHIAATFTPAEGADIRVNVGQTILETRLGAWLAKLEELAR